VQSDNLSPPRTPGDNLIPYIPQPTLWLDEAVTPFEYGDSFTPGGSVLDMLTASWGDELRQDSSVEIQVAVIRSEIPEMVLFRAWEERDAVRVGVALGWSRHHARDCTSGVESIGIPVSCKRVATVGSIGTCTLDVRADTAAQQEVLDALVERGIWDLPGDGTQLGRDGVSLFVHLRRGHAERKYGYWFGDLEASASIRQAWGVTELVQDFISLGGYPMPGEDTPECISPKEIACEANDTVVELCPVTPLLL